MGIPVFKAVKHTKVMETIISQQQTQYSFCWITQEADGLWACLQQNHKMKIQLHSAINNSNSSLLTIFLFCSLTHFFFNSEKNDACFLS